MPGATRVNLDTAGGLINSTPSNTSIRVQGYLWAQKGATVANHGSSPHDAATIIEGSTFIKINGVEACLAGHHASCGHTATGSNSIGASS